MYKRSRLGALLLAASFLIGGVALAAPAQATALDQSFTAAGLTSTYHVFDEGLDPNKKVGLLVWTDGSGGYGYDNPNASYLLDADGLNGMVQKARERNMVLLVPEAPAPGCDGTDNCWYNASAPAKADWAAALMTHIKGKYNIDPERIATGGYSSGAQWHRWMLPMHGEAQSVDLSVMVAYGGAPAVATDYSAAYKDDLVLVWNTGTNDEAYSTASWGAIGGYNWYTNAGFETHATWPQGVGHARGGEFDDIMAAAIDAHLPPATATTPVPEPEPEPQPVADYATEVNPTADGVTFTVDVPVSATEATYVRVTRVSDGDQKYLYTSREGDNVTLTFQTLGTTGEEFTYRVYSGSSTTQTPEAEGSFRTWTEPEPTSDNRLDSDEVLWTDEQISSANGQYRLIMQNDGNAVVYSSTDQALWSSETWTGRLGNFLVMQNDGNAVVYDPTPAPLWSSETWTGQVGNSMVLQDDGTLVVVDPSGATLWSSV